MNSTSSDRKIFLDVLKSLAIILVCIYHSEMMFVNVRASYAPNDYHFYISYFLLALDSMAVPLFFIINGALLFNKPYDHAKHLNKIIKLVFIVLLWSLITAISFGIHKHASTDIWELLKSVSAINHLWFLKALVLVYLLFPILKMVFDNPNQSAIFYYAMALFFVFSFGDFALNQLVDVLRFVSGQNFHNGEHLKFFPNINPFGNDFYAAFYLMLGGLLSSNRFKKPSINTYTLIAAFVFSWLLLFGYGILKSSLIGKTYDTVFSCYYSLMTLTMASSIYLLCQRIPYQNPRLISIAHRVGNNTLGIYLIHPILREFIDSQLDDKYQSLFFQSGLVGNILFALVLVVISLLITEFLRKIRYVRAILTS